MDEDGFPKSVEKNRERKLDDLEFRNFISDLSEYGSHYNALCQVLLARIAEIDSYVWVREDLHSVNFENFRYCPLYPPMYGSYEDALFYQYKKIISNPDVRTVFTFDYNSHALTSKGIPYGQGANYLLYDESPLFVFPPNIESFDLINNIREPLFTPVIGTKWDTQTGELSNIFKLLTSMYCNIFDDEAVLFASVRSP